MGTTWTGLAGQMALPLPEGGDCFPGLGEGQWSPCGEGAPLGRSKPQMRAIRARWRPLAQLRSQGQEHVERGSNSILHGGFSAGGRASKCTVPTWPCAGWYVRWGPTTLEKQSGDSPSTSLVWGPEESCVLGSWPGPTGSPATWRKESL